MKLKDFVIKTRDCTIVINGTLSLPLLGDNTFTGTIKVSGKDCPVNGNFTFYSAHAPSSSDKGDLSVTFDTKDPLTASTITWQGHAQIAAILNEDNASKQLRGAIKRLTTSSIDETIREELGAASLNLGVVQEPILRAFAAKAGDVHGAGLQHYLSEFRQARGDAGQVLKKALGDLHTQGAITTEETAPLQQIIDAISKGSNPSDAYAQAQKAHDALMKNAKTNVAAITVAGIAVDSLKRVKGASTQGEATVRRALNWRKIAEGDLMGALAGWMLGLAVTSANPVGGAVGAVTGAIIVSAVVANDQLAVS